VLRDLLSSAVATPSLTLSWSEVVPPGVTHVTGYQNSGDTVEHDVFNAAPLFLALRANSLHYLDTVVTNAVRSVCEVPESDLAAVTRLLLLRSLFYCLLLAALLEASRETFFADDVCADRRTYRLRIFFFGGVSGSFRLWPLHGHVCLFSPL